MCRSTFLHENCVDATLINMTFCLRNILELLTNCIAKVERRVPVSCARYFWHADALKSAGGPLWHKSKAHFNIRQKQIDIRRLSMLKPATAINGHENWRMLSGKRHVYANFVEGLLFFLWFLDFTAPLGVESGDFRGRNLLTYSGVFQVSSPVLRIAGVPANITVAKRFALSTPTFFPARPFRSF